MVMSICFGELLKQKGDINCNFDRNYYLRDRKKNYDLVNRAIEKAFCKNNL